MTQPLAKTSKCAASTRKNSRLLPFLRNRTDFFSGLLGSSTYGTQFTNLQKPIDNSVAHKYSLRGNVGRYPTNLTCKDTLGLGQGWCGNISKFRRGRCV
jgi:hypothetical protein